jgi:hypothetical protein
MVGAATSIRLVPAQKNWIGSADVRLSDARLLSDLSWLKWPARAMLWDARPGNASSLTVLRSTELASRARPDEH